MKKGISLSTLRRYIKANKVVYRIENGRYLLQDDEPEATTNSSYMGTGAVHAQGAFSSDPTVAQLNQQLQKAREEIAELKTLIAFYEESQPPRLDV